MCCTRNSESNESAPRLCECGHSYDSHHKCWAYGLECFACEVCGCPEYSEGRK